VKFSQLPPGSRFFFDGEWYSKSGPVTATREAGGKPRMIPRSADIQTTEPVTSPVAAPPNLLGQISKEEMNLFIKALAFAAHKHRDQRRKDHRASPYINHPIALADVLCNEGGITDIETICGALLHDTIEDTEATGEELAQEFGAAIRDLVIEVTDDKALPPSERKRLQVVHADTLSDKAKLIKLADKICNLRDVVEHPPQGWDLARRQAYFDWAKQVIDGLRGVHAELEAAFDATYARRPK